MLNLSEQSLSDMSSVSHFCGGTCSDLYRSVTKHQIDPTGSFSFAVASVWTSALSQLVQLPYTILPHNPNTVQRQS